MPELPDVAGFKAFFDRHALQQLILDVLIHKSRILQGVAPREFAGRLKNQEFTSSLRHGKLLFAATQEKRLWVLIHFGMSGYLSVCETVHQQPKDAAIVFVLEEKKCLAYASQRLLGKVSCIKDPQKYLSEEGLGPDALERELTAERIAEILSERRGMLKSALMNQGIIAGVGNEWSDEILFQCGLHPRVKVGDLNREQLLNVGRTLRRVLQIGVEANCQGRSLPHRFLGRHRHEDNACPHCNNNLASVKAAGRTSYYCPHCI